MKEADEISDLFAAVYHRCHSVYSVQLGHQAVRVLQLVAEERDVTVQRAAEFLGSARNTASEHVARLVGRGLLVKRRSVDDERVVQLTLTAGGRTALAEHAGLDRARLARALAGADAATRKRILDGFHALFAAVDKVPR